MHLTVKSMAAAATQNGIIYKVTVHKQGHQVFSTVTYTGHEPPTKHSVSLYLAPLYHVPIGHIIWPPHIEVPI